MRLFFLFCFLCTSLYGLDSTQIGGHIDWRGYFVIGVFILVLILMIKNYFPADITMVLGGSLPVIIGIVPVDDYLKSFANETLVTIAMLFIVAKAFEKTNLMLFLSSRFIPDLTNKKAELASILIPFSSISAFFNNIPLVLLFTPVIRKWAISKNYSPSKYLIPLSYAAILGGVCTLIGTSTNLVIYGLLQEEGIDLGFFEIGKVGIICAIVGVLYIILFSSKLLPKRVDPKTTLCDQIGCNLYECIIEENCPLISLSIEEAGKIYLDTTIIAIERNGQQIISPNSDLVLLKDDRMVFCADENQKQKLSRIDNLILSPDTKFRIEDQTDHYSEVAIPTDSILIGKTLRNVNYRANFGGTVIGIYRSGNMLYGKVSDIPIKAGDVLMILSAKPRKGMKAFKDLYFLKPEKQIVEISYVKSIFIFVLVVLIVTLAAIGVPIMLAAMGAAIIAVIFRLIPPREAIKSINFNLLILIAGGLTLAKAIEITGIAHFAGKEFIQLIGNNPHMIVGIIFLLTIILTELVTNVASAIIIFPIAIQAVQVFDTNLEGIKAIGITIAIAASCSFLTPIGYQTNTIVYGPGGYRFTDYLRLGLPLTFIIWGICTYLIPIFWQIG